MTGHVVCNWRAVWSTSRPSTPAAPRLARTLRKACCRFSRVNIALINADPASSCLCCGSPASPQPALDEASPRHSVGCPVCTDFWRMASRYQHRFRHSLSFALHRSDLVSVRLLWPLLTSRSGLKPLPFQALCEISPGKNALLHRTTAEFTLSCLDHESFAETCPLTLLNSALYPVLVHRLTIYAPRFLPTLGRPYAVALHFICCDQLMAGLTPAGVRPYRAHT